MKLFPILNINFPLRILFNFLHASHRYPLIKLNPGLKIENLIKLYTNQKSINDQKIPFLSKKKVIDLKNSIGFGNKLAIFINVPEKGFLDNLICEFDNNGVVHITLSSTQLLDVELISKTIDDYVNPLLQDIDDYTTQYGYSRFLIHI